MFPKFVSVAIAYSPTTYGRKDGWRQHHHAQPFEPAGRAFLARLAACEPDDALGGVFNGTIVNFNDAAFTADNGSTSLRDSADAVACWNADGVPVRLVGRLLDRLGTTDIHSARSPPRSAAGRQRQQHCHQRRDAPFTTGKVTATIHRCSTASLSIRACGLAALRRKLATSLRRTIASVPGSPNFGATVVGAEYWSGSAIAPAANAGGKVSFAARFALERHRLFVADAAAAASAISPTMSRLRIQP